MAEKKRSPEYSQYGMKDADAQATDRYANRTGGEEPGVGPTDSVTSSGHRVGAVEQRPDPKPSSRAGQKLIGEVEDKKR